jgi:hypothetical protein
VSKVPPHSRHCSIGGTAGVDMGVIVNPSRPNPLLIAAVVIYQSCQIGTVDDSMSLRQFRGHERALGISRDRRNFTQPKTTAREPFLTPRHNRNPRSRPHHRIRPAVRTRGCRVIKKAAAITNS